MKPTLEQVTLLKSLALRAILNAHSELGEKHTVTEYTLDKYPNYRIRAENTYQDVSKSKVFYTIWFCYKFTDEVGTFEPRMPLRYFPNNYRGQVGIAIANRNIEAFNLAHVLPIFTDILKDIK